MQLPRFASLPAIVLAFALAACNDPNALVIDPIIVDDTVTIALPGVDPTIGTALDITSPPGSRMVVGARFPERSADATQWDFALRLEGGELVLKPTGALGFDSGAGITRPITDRAFEQIETAPSSTEFVTDSAVALRTGAVYVARSRQISCGFGGSSQFARIVPLALDAAAGTAQLRVVTNEVCNDTRLTPKE